MRDFIESREEQIEEERKTNLTFYGSRFAVVSFPARAPKGRVWTRTNGRDTLLIEAGTILDHDDNLKELKVPSGIIPRRILMFLSHQWMKNRAKSVRDRKIILGANLNSFLENLEVKSVGGKQYKQLEEQATRLFNAKIAFHSKTDQSYSIRQALIADNYELWWDKVGEQISMFPSFVKVTEQFGQYLDKSMPLNLDTIKIIGGNCLAFDLYVWLNLRSYSILNPVLISWEKLQEQLGANYNRVSDFKKEVIKAFKLVTSLYKNNSVLEERGIKLVYSTPDIEEKTLSHLKSQGLLKNFRNLLRDC